MIPVPHNGLTEAEFLSEGITTLINEGYAQNQASCICQVQWDKSLRNIHNLTKKDIDRFIASIFKGELSLFEIFPQATELALFTFKTLDDSLHKGWGNLKKGEDILEIEKAVNYRQNIGRFSAAKTWQEARVLTENVFDSTGAKRSFKEFKEVAGSIDNQFNKVWLSTEQDTVFLQSQNAKQGIKILNEQEALPFIRYQTVHDGRVRESHAALDGLTFKVGDPRADEISPQNDWRCRCQWIQLDEARPTSKKVVSKQTKLLKEDFAKDPAFEGNPAKKDYVFKEKGKGQHDYFKIPKKFQKQLSSLVIPKGY